MFGSFRMKFLVRRWQQVTSTSSININRDGFGLSPGKVKKENGIISVYDSEIAM
jgi:hypothetical protein